MSISPGTGTIPAGAGSTAAAAPGPGCRRDHPRGRGEHGIVTSVQGRGSGPSPRARGARALGHVGRVGVGTIPAGAGSTSPVFLGLPRWQGPSPRARGALGYGDRQRGHRGTIPAGAGSTPPPRAGGVPSWDHPRGRGEHVGDAVLLGEVAGPSPRARGAPRRPGCGHARPGTIPAGAGSTGRDVGFYCGWGRVLLTFTESDI